MVYTIGREKLAVRSSLVAIWHGSSDRLTSCLVLQVKLHSQVMLWDMHFLWTTSYLLLLTSGQKNKFIFINYKCAGDI